MKHKVVSQFYGVCFLWVMRVTVTSQERHGVSSKTGQLLQQIARSNKNDNKAL